MPLPLIAALVAPFLAGGMMGRANAMQQQAEAARKSQDAETKQLMALGQSLSEGKGGDADVQALQALSHRFAAIPGGQQFYDAFSTRARGVALQGALQRQSMMQMFGLGDGQPMPAPLSPVQQVAQQVGSQGDGTTVNAQGQVTPAALIQAGVPQQPFTGQVGAIPQPQPGVQSAQPGMPAQRPAPQAEQENMQGLDMANAQPADMATAIQRVEQPPLALDATAQAPQTFDQKVQALDQQRTTQGTATPLPQAPVKLPPFLKTGLGAFTIPKDASGLGVELRGTAAELKHHYAARMQAAGMSPTDIYTEFQRQGVAPPEPLQKDAFNDFTKQFLMSPEMMRSPRQALQAIAQRFPDASLEAFKGFGETVFQSAFMASAQRLRAAGVHLTEGSIMRAAFNETVNAVGSEFVPASVLKAVEQSRATNTDSMMADLLEKGVEGDPNAMQLYGTMLRMKAGQLGVEEAAKQTAQIKAKQRSEFIQPTDLARIERNGQPLPFGTTAEQAAGRGTPGGPATVITPEQQATRTQRTTETDKLKFATERSMPLFNAIRDRVQEITTLASQAGAVGKLGALAGAPTELGQAVTRFDEFKAAFAGNLRALSGETAGVITEGDVKRIVDILPKGKDFVNLTTDRSNQLVRSFSEIQSLLTDRLGQKVDVFDPIIKQLKAKPTPEQATNAAADLEKALEGL